MLNVLFQILIGIKPEFTNNLETQYAVTLESEFTNYLETKYVVTLFDITMIVRFNYW